MSLPYREIEVEQGSPEWLALRRNYCTASQLPIVLGKSHYQTPLQLFEEKVFGVQQQEKGKQALFDRGHAAEAEIREWAKKNLGVDLRPAVLVSVEHPEVLASLDGWNEKEKVQLEAKFVGKKTIEELRTTGKLSESHFLQVQAQLLVTKFDREIYFATDPNGESAYIEVEPDPNIHELLAKEAKEFMEAVRSGKAPEPTERDFYHPKGDKRFDELAALYAQKKAIEQRYSEIEKALKSAYQDHKRVKCSGVTITRYVQKGTVDYAKIPELKNVDLEQYRKKPSERVRISVSSGGKSDENE